MISESLALEVHEQWMAAMKAGDFEAAWRQTDRVERLRRQQEESGAFVWTPEHLIWNSAPFQGRDVTILCNHGLGDTLQFLRFVPAVTRTARSVTLMVQPPLVGLLGFMPDLGAVRNGWTEDAPAGDITVEIMELAYACRCRPETLPLPPYLTHTPIREQGRVPRGLQMEKGFLNVGMAWAASAWDDTRSVPFSSLRFLASQPGVRFYSLQQEVIEADLEAHGIIKLSEETTEILDAAASLLELDLFITVDTMIAHLAGALDVPVWLLLKKDCDWRWMTDRSDSPWYPSMRLFRQTESGWDGLMERVSAALREKLAASAESGSTGSVGTCGACRVTPGA